MRPTFPRALLLAAALGAAPLGAQAPTRVMGAPYHSASRAFIDLMIPHHEMAVMMSRHAVTAARSDAVRRLAQRMIDEQTKDIDELKALRRSLYGSDSSRSQMMRAMMQMMGMHHMGDTAARAMMDSMRTGPGRGAPGMRPPGAMRDSMRMRPPGAATDSMRMRDTTRMRDSMGMRQPMPGMQGMPGMARGGGMPMTSGDFDRMFLEHMIAHHQDGADMAVLAEDSRASARVRQLARKIREEQERDMTEMRRVLGTLPGAASGSQ